MGRGGSQSTPRDEPRRMSPSSPLRARRCAGGGGQNVMHPRGGKLGFVTVSLENGQGKKYFILHRTNRNKLMWQLGRSPAGETPQFFSGGAFPDFFCVFRLLAIFSKPWRKPVRAGRPRLLARAAYMRGLTFFLLFSPFYVHFAFKIYPPYMQDKSMPEGDSKALVRHIGGMWYTHWYVTCLLLFYVISISDFR